MHSRRRTYTYTTCTRHLWCSDPNAVTRGLLLGMCVCVFNVVFNFAVVVVVFAGIVMSRVESRDTRSLFRTRSLCRSFLRDYAARGSWRNQSVAARPAGAAS